MVRARSGRRISWISTRQGGASPQNSVKQGDHLSTLARGPTHEPQLRDQHLHTSPSLAVCWWHIHSARNICSRGWVHYMNAGIAMSSLSALSCAHPCWRVCNDRYGLCSPSHLSCCRKPPSSERHTAAIRWLTTLPLLFQ